jgi:hypothetical protein
MDSGVCGVCEAEAEMAYRCNYCDGVFCGEHRLPEDHDCDGVEFLTDPNKRFESKFSDEVVTSEEEFNSPEPMDKEDIPTYSSVEPDWSAGKSPPVEINKGDEDSDDDKENEGGLISYLFGLLR